MYNAMGEKVCAHPGCACLMQEEEDYCSDSCEAAAPGDACTCGHLACTSTSSHKR